MDTPPDYDVPPLPEPQPEPPAEAQAGQAPEQLIEPQPEPAQRPPWVGWAATAGAIVLVAAGFFGARALAGRSSSNTAAGAAPTGAAPNGNGYGGFIRGGTGGQFGTGGTIASISGNTLTVTNPQSNATTKVVTSGSTRVTTAKTVTVSAIEVGDQVVVVGSKSGTTVTATRINDKGAASANPQIPDPTSGPAGANPPTVNGAGPAGYGPPGGPGASGPDGARRDGGGFTAGTVTSVSSGTVVVKALDGTTTTVKTSAATTVTKNVESSVSALKVGDSIRAMGATASDGTVTATSISAGEGGFVFGGRRDGTPATGAGS